MVIVNFTVFLQCYFAVIFPGAITVIVTIIFIVVVATFVVVVVVDGCC